MYYRLRSEFVRKFESPLSSDSYSAFGKDEADLHDKEVKKVYFYFSFIFVFSYFVLLLLANADKRQQSF